MIKLLVYLPIHLINSYLATLAPLWLFRATYTQSGETIREQETTVRNAARLAAYHVKKVIHSNA